MVKLCLTFSLVIALSACVVIPEVDHSQNYQCQLSSDKKYLKVVNLTDGDTSFYQWQDEMFSIITMPTSAIISSIYVVVNNVYHLGEKQIKCSS